MGSGDFLPCISGILLSNIVQQLNNALLPNFSLSDSVFFEAAEQFQRVVLACPRETLEKALYQLEGAVAELREQV